MRPWFLFFLIFCGACSYYKSAPVPPPAETALWNNHFDSTVLTNINLLDTLSTKTFYYRNNYKYIWTDSSGLTVRGDSMLQIIRSSETFGLIPNNYHLSEITQMLSRKTYNEPLMDIYLTDSFFGMSFHLKQGRVERKSLKKLMLSKFYNSARVSMLQGVCEKNVLLQTLRGQEPDFSDYSILKDTLGKLLARHLEDTTSLKHIDQLTANLERWRWQKELPDRYIAVNAPSYQLEVIESDTIRVRSKVIVGKFETQTPELESVVRSFIIYPYWHVPKSILKEILPHAQEDSLYLRRHNYDVLDRKGKTVKISSVDWNAYTDEDFPYVLRQREGSENTMGIIKFVFSNKYGVYLHDTNARGLFRKNERAMSHGCVRVQKAADVARYLVKDDDIVTPEDLDQYLQLQRRMEISLLKPIPVLLQYFTCEVVDGRVIFHNDIYKKDKALIDALLERKTEVDSTELRQRVALN